MSETTSALRRPRLDLSTRMQLVSDQESSGMSVKDFCAARGLSVVSFYQWRNRKGADQASSSECFSPIEIASKVTGSISVELPGGVILRFGALPPVEYLRSLSSIFSGG